MSKIQPSPGPPRAWGTALRVTGVTPLCFEPGKTQVEVRSDWERVTIYCLPHAPWNWLRESLGSGYWGSWWAEGQEGLVPS